MGLPLFAFARILGDTLRGPKLHPLDEYRVPLQVTLADLEVFRMNNGRFVTAMDIGRTGLALRCGLLPAMIRQRWTPLVAAVSIRYRRSLRFGDRYDLVTKVAAFDEKFWYFEQRFESKGDVVASAFVKALFHGPKGSVPTRDMLAAAGRSDVVSPPIPPSIASWLESEEAMRQSVVKAVDPRHEAAARV